MTGFVDTDSGFELKQGFTSIVEVSRPGTDSNVRLANFNEEASAVLRARELCFAVPPVGFKPPIPQHDAQDAPPDASGCTFDDCSSAFPG